jgi:predicted extracellular nuclease
MTHHSKQLATLPILRIGVVLLVLHLVLACSAQQPKLPANGLTVAFYNVENLFDTINDPRINDAAYLPTSQVPWTAERYQTKLDNISRVIAAMDTLNFPHILGLCEIENRSVLEDLAASVFIADAAYNIIHYDGPDRRGIEVALLYRPDFFEPIYSESVDVNWDGMGRSNPRDLLYVKGIIAPTDTLHIFVNHWSSRWGGQEQSEHLRIGTARVLRSLIDSLFFVNIHSNIIVMGDFNDNPDDASLFSHLRAVSPDGETMRGYLYNLAMIPYIKGEGTSVFNNNWDFFDQIILSSNLIKPVQNGWVADELEVIKKPWMLFYPPRGGEPRPNRTATGRSYFGGYSDHLPVMVRLRRN